MNHRADYRSDTPLSRTGLHAGSIIAALGLVVCSFSATLAAPHGFVDAAISTANIVATAQASQDPKPDADQAERERLRKLVRDNADRTLREIREQGGKLPEPIDLNAPLPKTDVVVNPPEQPEPSPTPKVDGPHIVFDQPVHEFGLVMDKQELKCVFTFRNAGTQTLIIEKVNTGCGCTVANMPKQQFAPGETGSIEITYNPKGTGNQNRSMQVMTNDAKQRVTNLGINAHVLPLIEARPNTIQFGQVVCGQERKVELVIVSRDPSMVIESITTNGPEIIAKEVPGREPAQLVEAELPGRKVIEVTLSPDAPPGRVLKMITIKAKATKPDGTAETHEMRVNAFAAIKGELSVQPPFIRVRPLAIKEGFEREAIITREGGQPFQILETKILNATLEGVTTEIQPYESGQAKGYKVIIRGAAGEVPKNFRGTVVVTTDMPKEPTLEVQFSGLVRAPIQPGGSN